MDEKLYTEKEILEYLNYPCKKSQGSDRILTVCNQAGLKIETVDELKKGRSGGKIYYRILEDNFNIPGEIWVDVYCSNNHEVSNFGRIRNKNTKKLMGSKMKNGYITVGFNNKHNLRGHRVVFFSFHPELLKDEELYIIDHINGKRDDNRLENLRPISSLENVKTGKQNQKDCQTLLAQLLLKFGYEETQQKLLQLLNED